MTKLSIVLWFRVSHCETPGGGRGNLLRGMQSIPALQKAMGETASLRYTPLAVTTYFVVVNRALSLSKAYIMIQPYACGDNGRRFLPLVEMTKLFSILLIGGLVLYSQSSRLNKASGAVFYVGG